MPRFPIALFSHPLPSRGANSAHSLLACLASLFLSAAQTIPLEDCPLCRSPRDSDPVGAVDASCYAGVRQLACLASSALSRLSFTPVGQAAGSFCWYGRDREQPKRSPLCAFRSPSGDGAPACKHLHTIFLYRPSSPPTVVRPRSVVPRAPERRSPVKLLPKMFSVEKNPSHEPAYVWCAPRAQQDRSLGSRVSGQVEARSEPLGFSESRDALAPIRYADHLSLRLPFAHEYYHRTLVITEI